MHSNQTNELVAICHLTPYHPSIHHLTPEQFYYSFIYFVCYIKKHYNVFQSNSNRIACLFVFRITTAWLGFL